MEICYRYRIYALTKTLTNVYLFFIVWNRESRRNLNIAIHYLTTLSIDKS